jgi:hypothetical protein
MWSGPEPREEPRQPGGRDGEGRLPHRKNWRRRIFLLTVRARRSVGHGTQNGAGGIPVVFFDFVPEEYTGRPEAYGLLCTARFAIDLARPPTELQIPLRASFEERVTRAPPEDVSATRIAYGD